MVRRLLSSVTRRRNHCWQPSSWPVRSWPRQRTLPVIFSGQKREVTGHRALIQAKQRLSRPVSSREPPLVPPEPHPAPYSSHKRSNHSTSLSPEVKKAKQLSTTGSFTSRMGDTRDSGNSWSPLLRCWLCLLKLQGCLQSKAERGLRRSSQTTALQYQAPQTRPCIHPFLSFFFLFSFVFVFRFC